MKYIKKNSIILEIGPGAGRWSTSLQKIAKKLILTDITEKCIEICMELFKEHKNVEYKLIEKRLDFLDKNSIEYIWSYDVFVHINPFDVELYLEDFSRILKPGGISIIHHTGSLEDYVDKKSGWKTFMGKEEFAKLVIENEMDMIEQNLELIHFPGDIISIFKKRGTNE